MCEASGTKARGDFAMSLKNRLSRPSGREIYGALSLAGHIRRLFVCVSAVALPVMLILIGGGFSSADAAGPSDALTETKDLVQEALSILKNPALTLPDERRQLRDLAAPHFAFQDMARSALGYHWKDLSSQQRADFARLFTAFIQDAYLNKIQAYSGQDIEFIRESASGADDVEVYSRVVQKGAEPIAMNFMLERLDGDWKIYDVIVDGISITGNYRSQFSRVINNQGFDQLMNELTKKEVELASLLGKR
jgi:phospholipid transport system substrate-binding protein